MTTRMISQKAVVEIWISRLRSRRPAAPHRLARKSGRPKSTSRATPPACIPSHPWAFGWMECTYFMLYNYLPTYYFYSYISTLWVLAAFVYAVFNFFFLRKNTFLIYLQSYNSYFHPPQFLLILSCCSPHVLTPWL